ncbi:tollo [Carabus blaptoides fortunei]
MDHRRMFWLLLLVLILQPTSTRADCSVTRTSEDRMVENWRHGYGYNYRTETTYKYYIKCILSALHMGVPLTTYMTGYASEATKALSIEFSSSTINTVPVGVFHTYSAVETLTLNNVSINSISPGAFSGMTQLQELYLNNNNISELQVGTFDGLAQLKRLELSGNKLATLKSLNGLTNLELLTLSSNNIKTIDVGAFKDTGKLVKLDISDNQLVNLSAALFSTLPELRKLHLQNNYIDHIPAGLFNTTKSLDIINMRNNTIRSVPCNELMGAVDLRFNRITSLGNCSKNIVQLDVSNNHLTSLPAMFFNAAATLTTLGLTYNNISTIHGDAFMELRSLTSLTMNNNNITTIPIGTFRNLSKLTTLDLSYNNLIDLKFGVFTGLIKLQVLDVSNNKIVWLESKVLFPLKSLTHLKLDGNLLRSFDANTMASHLTTLKYISLDRNQMQCEWLTSCIYVFTLRNITVLPGDSFKTSNVHGIYCVGENELGNVTMVSNISASGRELLSSSTKLPVTMKPVVSAAAEVPRIAIVPRIAVPNTTVLPNITLVPTAAVVPTQVTTSTTRKPPTPTPLTPTKLERPGVSTFTPEHPSTTAYHSAEVKFPKPLRTDQQKTNDLLESILKANSSIPSLLITVSVSVIILIIITLAISLFNMYSIRRMTEKRRKSPSSCAVELLHVTD